MATNPKPQAPWGEYVPHTGPMTVEQFEKYPSEDGWTYELHQGRLIRMPGPGGEHGIIQRRLLVLIANYLTAQNIAGETFGTACYYFPTKAGETVLCPDISYIVPARVASITYRGSYVETIPDLVIEISSPNDFRPTSNTKVEDYLNAGVKMVWVLWPKSKTVEIWRPTQKKQPTTMLREKDTLDGLDIIPGFTCLIKNIFV